MQFICNVCNFRKEDINLKNKRIYTFIAVIYEDDENFDDQMANLKQENEVLYIRHDQDVNDETGDLKKPHYHFFVRVKNPCTISAFAKRVGVAENLVEPLKKSFNGALKYLIHFGNEDKYQYEPSSVLGNSDRLLQKFNKLVAKETSEEDKTLSIEQFILQYDKGLYLEWPVVAAYVRKMNMWDAFRRNSWYFGKLVDSHNCKVSSLRYNIPDGYYEDL